MWTSAVETEYRGSKGLGADVVEGTEVRIDEMRRFRQLRDQDVTREISAMVRRAARRVSDQRLGR